MPSVGVGQQHGVWEMLAQHVGIADWNHIVEDAVDDQARLHDLAELGETLATVLFPSSKGHDLSDCDVLAGQRLVILLSLLLPEVLTWGVDAVICALGTTSGKAGSKETFRQVDYVLPLAFAKLAHQQGAEAFALVSAIGADANSSFFYPKTKGEVERDMKLVGFKSLTILRPSIIGGKRDKSRIAEGLVLTLSRILAPVLPKKFHINPAAKIAGVLLDSVIAAVPGCHYRYAESLT